MPTSPSARIRLALTLGDPAGIGPEVLVKAADRWSGRSSAGLLVIGRAFILNALARKMRRRVKFADVDQPVFASEPGAIPCYFPTDLPVALSPARPQKTLTRAAVRSIEIASELALSGVVQGVVTSPINKAGLKRAGFRIPGHTEFLAELSGTKRFEMMLAGGPLRVVLVTRHAPLSKVPRLLTADGILETLLLTDRELRASFGISRPRLAVCGLNPHAGEAGTIGKEEIEIIEPAVRKARRLTDAEIIGPLPPDTVFYGAYAGRYDAEICMYHDQGLIPLKMISRGHGVNITLGLPFVRTSPDHGTAYDIAGKLIADESSMFDAMETASRICRARMRHHANEPRT